MCGVLQGFKFRENVQVTGYSGGSFGRPKRESAGGPSLHITAHTIVNVYSQDIISKCSRPHCYQLSEQLMVGFSTLHDVISGYDMTHHTDVVPDRDVQTGNIASDVDVNPSRSSNSILVRARMLFCESDYHLYPRSHRLLQHFGCCGQKSSPAGSRYSESLTTMGSFRV